MKFIYDSVSTIDAGYFEPVNETSYFSEDKLPKRRQEFSGSMVINETEPYRHGVEINSDRAFSAGIVRFHSGERGHRLKTSIIGIDDDVVEFLNSDTGYEEIETYDPLKAIYYPPNRLLWDNNPPVDPECFTTYVSTDAQCTYEHGQLKNVIEPLSIRPAATFMSTYYPHEAHTVWGNLCGGNLYTDRSTDVVASHYETSMVSNHDPYYDTLSIKEIPTINSTVEYSGNEAILKPFIDEKLAEKLTNDLSGSINSFSKNFDYHQNELLTNQQKSCTSGYQYDGAYRGTDSIAFGGLKY